MGERRSLQLACRLAHHAGMSPTPSLTGRVSLRASQGHRRFVSKLAGVSAEEELQHAESLIERNFSNYSAWHERARLLTKIHGETPLCIMMTMSIHSARHGSGRAMALRGTFHAEAPCCDPDVLCRAPQVLGTRRCRQTCWRGKWRWSSRRCLRNRTTRGE